MPTAIVHYYTNEDMVEHIDNVMRTSSASLIVFNCKEAIERGLNLFNKFPEVEAYEHVGKIEVNIYFDWLTCYSGAGSTIASATAAALIDFMTDESVEDW